MDNFLMSFLMMILWSILFGLLFVIVRKTKLLRNRLGITACIVVCICLYIRMMIPYDIGLFQRVQIDWEWFCNWYDLLNMKKLFFGRFSFSQILCVIWIVAAVILLLLRTFLSLRIRHRVSVSSIPATSRMQKALEEIMKEGGFHRKPEIVIIRSFRSSYSIGLLHQKIIMPARDYSDKELYYILLHEMMHFRSGDLWLMAAANIMCCVFWWNPLSFMLQRELETVLEVRCDIRVSDGRSKEERTEYLRTIITTMQEAGPKEKRKTSRKNSIWSGIGFARTDTYESMMHERFTAVAEGEKLFGDRKSLSFLWIAAMVGLLIVSYSIVIFPYHQPELSEDEEVSRVMSEDIWITEQKNGQYVLHFEEDGIEYQEIISEKQMLEFEKAQKETKR